MEGNGNGEQKTGNMQRAMNALTQLASAGNDEEKWNAVTFLFELSDLGGWR